MHRAARTTNVERRGIVRFRTKCGWIVHPYKPFSPRALQSLENTNTGGKRAFAFDTRARSRFAGSAGKKG